MSHRCIMLAGLLSLVTLLADTGLAQAPNATSTWTPPRTAWGEPDLQGTWSNATITPLQRPADLAGKEFLTAEEAAERERRAVLAANDEARGDDPARDLANAYNDFWWDRGTKVIPTRRTSLIVDPPDGRIPWLPDVQAGFAARAESRQAMLDGRSSFNSWVDLDTGERCLTDGLPWVPYAYNNNYEIVQSPGYLAIRHEMFYELRVIRIDAGPKSTIPQWFGQSRGRWEGNTLVVETTNFADKASYWWAADWRAPRPSLHLIERFTRVGPDTLAYEFTVTDPTMFRRPWTANTPMTRVREAVYEYACHEGNEAMPNMLRGSRVQEEGDKKPAGGPTSR